MFKVPKFFHDVLGEEIAKLDMILIITFSFLATILLFVFNTTLFNQLSLITSVIVLLLIFDIFAGVLSNFSDSTNAFYRKRSINRWIFIAIHIQPIIFAWLLDESMRYAFLVWGLTIISACIVNFMLYHPNQRMVGAFLMAMTLFFTMQFGGDETLFIRTVFIFYVIKVVYSFAVNHEFVVKKEDYED